MDKTYLHRHKLALISTSKYHAIYKLCTLDTENLDYGCSEWGVTFIDTLPFADLLLDSGFKLTHSFIANTIDYAVQWNYDGSPYNDVNDLPKTITFLSIPETDEA